MRRWIVAAAAAGVAGCGVFSDEELLPGERIPVRQTQAERVAPPETMRALSALGAPVANADWSQPNAVAGRAPGHLAAPAAPTLAWTADAGTGSGSSARITSAPVVSDGRVFALDAEAQVTAVDAASGRPVWRADVSPESQSGDEGFGGGLAAADGRIFAATGFGEVVALSAADGAEIWRQRLSAPLRAAPAVDGGRVIVVTRDNSGVALDAETGAVQWRILSSSGGAGTLRGASPAVSGELVVLPFTSGELLAVRASNGRRLWSDVLAGGRRGLARAAISDASGAPVIAGGAVFAANQAGQFVAIDGRTGQRGWLRALSSTTAIWAAGQTLFLIDDERRLMRLAASSGETLWATDLPAYEDPDDRDGVINYGGPVVAGGRVWITSTEGFLLGFDPDTGAETARLPVSGGSSTGPVVAGGAIYVLSDSAVLHAFR
jgi:outer membrane protein assembly factor BamB